MTTVHPADYSPASAASHLLHNSGPCSREVFRTAAIGERMRFSLGWALLDWRDWGGDQPARLAALVQRRADIPPAIAIAAARRALVALGERCDDHYVSRDRDRATRSACALLTRLASLLRERGLLDRLIGLASDEELQRPPWRTDPNSAESRFSAEDFARTLVAYSVYAPPLLLWTRPPSLHWWRTGVRITLRRFHGPGCLTSNPPEKQT